MSVASTGRKWSLRRIIYRILAVAAVVFVLAVVLLDVFKITIRSLPEPRPVIGELVTLPQDGWQEKDPGWHWDTAGRNWFHHADQGTTIMPYSWIIALEQPDLGVLRYPGLFLEPGFMSRFGFLPGAADPSLNPDGKLPIGWAIGRNFTDPTSDPKSPEAYNAKPYDTVGLTCAACHTGRVTYQQVGGKTVDLLIEGGSAMINVLQFQNALGEAILFTLFVPLRFERFADRVLGKENTSENRSRLRAQVSSWLKEASASQIIDDRRHVEQLVSGFARTDALSLIGNRVFGPIDQGNVIAAGAPVNFPHIWDAAWFDWVQYNASIRMVMSRNIGEALGVGARTNVTPGDPRLLHSTVNVSNLHEIEDQLGGPAPFRGLLAPKWDDAVKYAGFPPLKPELVAQGKALYEKKCLGCHGPSVDGLKADYAQDSPKYWIKVNDKPPFNQKFLNPPIFALTVIGTDPAQASDFASRFAKVPDPFPGDTMRALEALNPKQLTGAGAVKPSPSPSASPTPGITLSAASGLRVITEQIRDRAYAEAKLTDAQRAAWDRYRAFPPNLPEKDIIIANLKYRARPLDGVWATPPYLHNASVPNLDALLSPVVARPPTFPIGNTLYDTELVGYRTDIDPGKFQLDTTVSGNYNTGHEFRDLTVLELETYKKIFSLNAKLSADERWARLFDLTPEAYAKLNDEERRALRRKLTEEAIEAGHRQSAAAGGPTFFGVIGSGLDAQERRAIIEYVKSL
ncbi:MAG: di-heme-cytochrome C peroxidase [Isosphaeraceae bacterium]